MTLRESRLPSSKVDHFGRHSVTVQLMLLAVLPLAVLFVALNLFYAHNRNTLLDEQFNASVHDLSRALATAATQSLLAGDMESLDGVVREMLKEPNIYVLRLDDPMGDSLVEQGRNPRLAPPGSLRQVYIPLCIAMRGDADYQRIGEAWIWFDQSAVQASKRSGGLWALGLALGLAILVAWVAWRLANRILRPLREALLAMERMGRGVGGVRVAEDADNELRQLQQGVNLLADALENQDRLHEQTRSLTLERERAEQAKQVRTLFLAHMSHEIRTPLNALVGFMHLFRRELVDQEMTLRGRQYLEAMDQSARHLGALVADILDFSRIESGKVKMRSVSFSVTRLMDEVAVELAERARAKGLYIDVIGFLDVPDQVRGDPLRLRQVLANLLSNAIKFCPKGGMILRAMLEQPADAQGQGCVLRFEVEDSGPGIPPQARRRLLEPFEQIDSGMRRTFEGSGLGLSICRGLVEQAGGSLTIGEGDLGGALLSFTWPVTDAVSEPEPPRLPVSALVLDDRPSFRQAAYARFSRLGWRVTAREVSLRPGGAVDILNSLPDGGAVLTLRDPVERGEAGREALLELLHEAPRKVRHMLVCTSRDEPSWERRLEMRGAVVIRCPATQRDLERAVEVLGDTPFLASQPPAAGDAPGSWCEGRTVLVVDDHPLNREVLTQMLELAGASARQAESGEEALARLAREEVDAVLLDLHMPGMDGETALRLIRQRYTSMPVVILTADTLGETAARLREAGARAVLHKPVSEGELARVLVGLFGGPSQRRREPPSWPLLRERFWGREWPLFEERLSSARAVGDAPVMRETLHTLAGTAGLVGLNEVARAARHLEQLWQSGVSSRDADAWQALLRAAEEEKRK
ncbi:MAG: response regulator [Pseudomonadota bacterium]